MDTGSKGAIIGMTTATTVAEIYRGCMEGIAYEMLLNMEYLRDTGVRFKKLQASGGGAASSLWMQMKADVLNIPMRIQKCRLAEIVFSICWCCFLS